MTIKVALVDDESIARARLRRLLSGEPDIRIVAECSGGAEAIDTIIERQPDVVFLDVQMPECDGFQVVRSIPEHELPLIVFVTAYDAYALRAFDANALDYLLKPFDGERLQSTLKRVRARAKPGTERRQLLAAVEQLTSTQRRMESATATPRTETSAADGPRYRERFLVRVEGKLRFIAARDVDYIESAANYVRVHVGTDEFSLREPIGAVAESLDPVRFVRIHRQTIVNLTRVHEIEPWFSGDAVITMKDGRKLRLSRSYHRTFHERLG